MWLESLPVSQEYFYDCQALEVKTETWSIHICNRATHFNSYAALFYKFSNGKVFHTATMIAMTYPPLHVTHFLKHEKYKSHSHLACPEKYHCGVKWLQ